MLTVVCPIGSAILVAPGQVPDTFWIPLLYLGSIALGAFVSLAIIFFNKPAFLVPPRDRGAAGLVESLLKPRE
jgi:hypothetical protein